MSPNLSLNSTQNQSQQLDSIVKLLDIAVQTLKAQQHKPKQIDPNIQKNQLIHQVLTQAAADGTKNQLPYLKGMTLLQLRRYIALHYPNLVA